MFSSGLYLLILLLAAVIFIIYSTAKVKLHAFLVLIVTAFGVGLLAGLPLSEVIETVTTGFGNTLNYIGIIIAAGSIIGVLLEKGGGALVMAETIVKWIGKARSVLAMSITGSVISIPVFCDSGFIILSPLIRSLAEKANKSLATYAVALSMGLYTTHVFVPPTPGPIAAAAELGANIGWVMLIGIIVSIPVLVVTWLFAEYLGSKIYITPEFTETPSTTKQGNGSENFDKPGVWKAFSPILVPLILIALKSITELPGQPFGTNMYTEFILFIGDPNIALLLGVVLAFYTVSAGGEQVYRNWVQQSLEKAGSIILITGAGGALGSIMQSTELGAYLGGSISNLELNTLSILLPFLLAAALKTTLGSSTVAIITTASIFTPMLADLQFDIGFGPVLVTLAIGAGAMTVSHANDSYFWVVCQFTNMSVEEAYKLQTVSSGVAGITGIITVYTLSLFLL